MTRRLVAMTLLVSFIAMASSGLLMLVVDQPSFSLRMHPVHKLFGILMVVAASIHLVLNQAALRAHLRQRAAALWASALALILVGVYAIAIMNPVDAEVASRLDAAAREAEAHE
ncbi:DUF4405 domain-containing protein [Viridibacterium curvum]|uniref:Flavinylation-associated cytochrome domain-containing protein n=1 Tax=Viridibacterium curvum TaxID=1101404 RepID=A0ABP9QJE4_9RHOO